jgi:hypothetical protein
MNHPNKVSNLGLDLIEGSTIWSRRPQTNTQSIQKQVHTGADSELSLVGKLDKK